MSLYTYVDLPNSNLICCICRTPFTDPVSTRTCSHTFCHDCILQALNHAPQCPVDRSPLSTDDLATADPIVRSLVDELVVECVHRLEGCDYTCQRQLIAVHLKDDCPYAEVVCPEEGCYMNLKRKDMEEHAKVHDQDRPEQEDAEDETNEIQKESRGTQTSTPSVSSSSQERQISMLTEQNILLRHRLNSMEAMMLSMKRDLSCVKAGLGPWYRPGGNAVGLHPESSNDVQSVMSSEVPTRTQPSTASTSAAAASYFHYVAEDAPHMQSQMPPGREPYSYARDAIAPYFPSESDEQQHQHYAYQPPFSGVGRPGIGHHASSSIDVNHPAGSFARPISASIAPLNLGGTLEGTLNGLRESMVTLAAGVDSLGRRSEIAMTNETLRLGEEVMSLRAGLHGLRMQVHAMMMDRNAVITGRGGVEGAIPSPEGWMPLSSPRMHFGMPGGGPGQPQSITKL